MEIIAQFSTLYVLLYGFQSTPGCSQYFKSVMDYIPANYGVRAANVLLTEVMEHLNDRDLSFEKMDINPSIIAEIISLIETEKIHVTIGKNVLTRLFDGDKRSATQVSI